MSELSPAVKSIYITGYPRSGNTWLGRLLADVIGCEYKSLVDVNGDWPGPCHDAPFTIYKTHLAETPDLARTVFIYRDPRDVAVSVAHYSQHGNLRAAIDSLTHFSKLFSVGSYSDFMAAWWYSHKAAVEVRYCDLHHEPIKSLTRIVTLLTDRVPKEADIRAALNRQSVANTQRRYKDTHHIRHGVIGDWLNYFDLGTAEYFDKIFGQLLIDQGFEVDHDWLLSVADKAEA